MNKELHEGDLIIINIPTHVDGRFEQSVELTELKKFFKAHSGANFILYMHIFGGSTEYCQDYSEFLSKDLRGQLNCENVTIEGKGSAAPLFRDKESPLYISLNSRIEILVKQRNP